MFEIFLSFKLFKKMDRLDDKLQLTIPLFVRPKQSIYKIQLPTVRSKTFHCYQVCLFFVCIQMAKRHIFPALMRKNTKILPVSQEYAPHCCCLSLFNVKSTVI